MNNNKKSYKSPQSLVVGDTFTQFGTQYRVLCPVTTARQEPHARQDRALVMTNQGDLKIPFGVPLKMVL